MQRGQEMKSCMCQTYFLHFPWRWQRESGTWTTQEVKATNREWLLLSICMPTMRLSSTPSTLHLQGPTTEDTSLQEPRLQHTTLSQTQLCLPISLVEKSLI